MKASNKHANSVAKLLRLMIEGLSKSFPANKTLELDGSTVGPVDAVKKIQTTLVPFDTADTARLAASTAVHDRDATLVAAKQLLAALEISVRTVIGTTNPALKDFGLKPRVAHPHRTVAGKAEAAAKGAETRKAHEEAMKAKPPVTPPQQQPGK